MIRYLMKITVLLIKTKAFLMKMIVFNKMNDFLQKCLFVLSNSFFFFSKCKLFLLTLHVFFWKWQVFFNKTNYFLTDMISFAIEIKVFLLQMIDFFENTWFSKEMIALVTKMNYCACKHYWELPYFGGPIANKTNVWGRFGSAKSWNQHGKQSTT